MFPRSWKTPKSPPVVRYSLLLILVAMLCLQLSQLAAAQAGGWWDTQWGYRVPITVNSNGTPRTDKPAEIALNFTQLLSGLGVNGTFDPNAIRVIEVNGSNSVVDDAVPFQFDRATNYNATTNAAGTLVVLMTGATAANAARTYHVYFDLTGKGFTAPTFTPLLTLTDNVFDEDQLSYQIETQRGTYYYQKQGAAFSSLVDQAGNDWFGYKPTGGAGGSYRGVPNMIHPEGKFHPGSPDASSSILAQGPLKVTIKSTTNDNKWETLWEIFPTYPRMTLLKIDHAYWFLYEGTPGGNLDQASDLVVRANGTQTLASVSWDEDIAGPEWVYFADPTISRSFFAANHTNDTLVDSYWPMTEAAGSMTVFGFGRSGVGKYLTATPARFTIGLMDTTQFNQSAAIINNAYIDLSIQTGSATTESTMNTPTRTPTNTVVPPTSTPTKTPVPPTNTPTKTPVPPTNTPTKTPVPPTNTPTNTPVPPTNTPTNTPVPPTNTPTNTPVPPTETPTNTLVPPTNTPTDTVVPPTNTPVPPTETPTTPTGETSITNFTAVRATNGVSLQWQTSKEVNTAGFYLYRALSGEETFTPLTVLLPTHGAQGGTYQFVDTAAQAGQEYSYLIVEEKQDGSLVEYRALILVFGIGEEESTVLFLPLVSN